MTTPTGRRRTALAAVLALLLSACSTGLRFTHADQLDITAPPSYGTSGQPVLLDWEITDEELRRRLETEDVVFGVFVDRAPVPPGTSILTPGDDDCADNPDCPDTQWLAEHGIYATRSTSLLLSSLADNRTSERRDARDVHEAVIVLLDSAGYRISEDYTTVTFHVDRSA